MALNDPIANMLSVILNAEKVGRSEIVIKPVSKLIEKILTLMNDHGYVGSYKIIEDGRGNFIKLNLLGRINNCGVIKPRYPVQITNFERFEKRYLPAKDFGIIIVSTNKGLMTHIEAKEKKVGGALIGFVY